MGDSPDITSPNAINGVALDTDELCLKNTGSDFDQDLSDGVSKKMNDNDRGNSNTDIGQHDEPLPPDITTSPSVCHEDKGNLSAEVRNCVNDDVGSDSNDDSHLSHSVSDKQQLDIESEHGDADSENREQCLDQVDNLDGDVSMGMDSLEMQNSAADGGNRDGDLSHSASGNVQSEHRESADSELCLDPAASDLDADVSMGVDCSKMQNSAADSGDNSESHHGVASDPGSPQKSALCAAFETESATMPTGVSSSVMRNSTVDGDDTDESQRAVTDDSPQKSALCAASETESADSNFGISDAEELPMNKRCENGDADAGKTHAVAAGELQLQCDSEAKTVSGNAETATNRVVPASVELKCETAGEYSINSSSPSTLPVSTAGDVKPSAASLGTIATVVISAPLLSSSSASGLLSKVAVLHASASTAVTRPTQQSSKPVVPSTTDGSSGGVTRQMSKVLQDVGLLLVSERVFKNLAVIQEQKLADHQRQSDRDLLQKLKTSHQNLVAKNHGLLMPSRKCRCGFRSESANVIEAHCLSCDTLRRCCYCEVDSVYRRSQKLMKQHLWKAHRKIGNIDYHLSGAYMCPFCPLDFVSYFTLNNHMDACRRKFWLAANLAPREHDKDIPVTTAAKQPAKTPVLASSARMPSAAAVSRNLSASTLVSSATTALKSAVQTASYTKPRAIVPPHVGLRLTAPARNAAPVTQFIQIGKQVYPIISSSTVASPIGKQVCPILPPSTVASPVIAVNRSSASTSKVALNSAVQTASYTKPSLPVIVSSGSINPLAANRPVLVPTPVLPCSSQFTTCTVCGAFVKDKTALLVHLNIAHGATHKLCQYCCSPDVTFPSTAELHCHISKCHTSACWICKACFQPADRLINHVAERHKVTMAKMLELRRCYLCPSVPLLSKYSTFEEHMIKLHPLQFADIGKLWDSIIWSSNADRNWYAKQNPDGTLECPMCLGQFISTSFIYRHFHLEHNGSIIRFVNCPQCVKRMPANILQAHFITAHSGKCSVKLTRVDMPEHGCIFVPPAGTKRLKNRRGEPASNTCPRPLKRVKTAETVIISDSDDDDDVEGSYDEETHDDTNDKDFVVNSRVKLQPTPVLQRRSTRSRVDRCNSCTDDVHEVLESIVDSGESETISRRSVGYVSSSTSIRSAAVGTASATQLNSGITEDEVEIIDSIVPGVCDRRVQPASKPKHYKQVSAAIAKSTKSQSVDLNGGGDVDLGEYNGDCLESSTKPQPAATASSAEHLMERNQIMSNSVEEVMEVDGETLLIVHGDDSDDEDDDSDESD